MAPTLSLLVLLPLVVPAAWAVTVEELDIQIQELTTRLDTEDTVVKGLTRQLLLHEFQAQERTRVEGDSGIVQVANYEVGTYNFDSYTHLGETAGSMHDHGRYIDTVGWGKFTAVLNGIQFTTRHNDPLLRQPSTISTNFSQTEEVPFPEVPPSVLAKETVNEQMEEMQEYFRAFSEQNPSHRNYTPYFKPVLGYLEGTWLSDTTDLVEPYEIASWRRFEPETWQGLQDEARLEAHTGGDISYGNKRANLPRMIVGYDDATQKPIYAQWTYRIVFKPIDFDVKTEYFRLKDESLYEEMYPDRTVRDKRLSRGTVFILDDGDAPGLHGETLLDKIMASVPGLDNIPGTLLEEDLEMYQPTELSDNNVKINLGYYNHRYQTSKFFMRRTEKVRGLHDANMYVALNTQDKVAPLKFHFTRGNDVINEYVRASYAIPLEILYLTPLLSWNPLELTDFGNNNPTITTPDYNGFTNIQFYKTPRKFYKSPYNVLEKATADDFWNRRYIMDTANVTHKCAPSGILSVTPPIANGVGPVRLRYPIFPVHFEGNAMWKSLNSLRSHLGHGLKNLTETIMKF